MARPPRLHAPLQRLSPSATVAINERSNALRAEGRDIYKLGLGQSPFPVHEPVVASLREHAAEKDYLPVRGLLALREAVAAYHRRRGDVEASAAEVMIGPGSKELMFLLQLSLQAELLLPAPSWVSYAPQAAIVGRPCQYIDTRREDGFRLQADALDAYCRSQRDEDAASKNSSHTTRLLVLNYPNNPTGMSYTSAELEAIAGVARAHGVLVLSDEIYGELNHEGAHVSIARFYPEGTIVSGGISKWCGAGGWRLGTFVFPSELHRLQAVMETAASETFTSVSAPIQYAAIEAYRETPALDDYLHRSRRVLKALGRFCASSLRAAGAHCPDPEGGFYLFPDLSELAPKLHARGISNSAKLCARLLEDTGVAVLPGSDFGRPAAELSLRLAYVDFDGAQALAAADPEVAIDEAFLRAHSPRVVEAMARMTAWLAS